VTSEGFVKGEDPVRRSLARLRSIQGLVSASLVEPDSAHVLETVVAGDAADRESTDADSTEDPTRDPATLTVAAGASDIVQVIGLMAAGLGEPDDLEDVIITLGQRHHLITPLPGVGSDGLLIVVTLDRTRTNLAMARQQLRSLEPLLDIPTAPRRVS
jgi:hypothetical protein